MDVKFLLYKPGEIDVESLESFLKETDDYVIPSLSTLVNISDYAKKLAEKATMFVALDGFKIVGISATYVNKAPSFSYGTYLCVLKPYQDDMIGIDLILKSIDYCKEYGSASYRGEIRKANKVLWHFYKRLGFVAIEESVYPNSDVSSLIIELKY